MKTVAPELVEELIEFASTEEARRAGFARSQLEGATAAFNMLARNRVAYLADEVGMGKTYVALGVMGLLRHFNPSARIVVLTPRENIQRKWIKELRNFVRLNWRHAGNRVKSIQGTPAWPPALCDRLTDLGHELALHADRDFFLRMTSFSLSVKEQKARGRLRQVMRELLPWLDSSILRVSNPHNFIEAFGCAFNALVPPIDLLVVDEGHNLKHGFGSRESIRNRMLGYVFGAAPAEIVPQGLPGYGPRVERLLILSATPFEDDYGALQRQLGVFGFGDAALVNAEGRNALSVQRLLDAEAPLDERREIVGRFMLRRVSHLRIAGRRYTKNMYRREWRGGGLSDHDDPMHITDARERLVVALVQKKVAEVLQDERFNNHFQIGMLSSFESFLQSVSRRHAASRAAAGSTEEETAPEDAVFDGDQATSDTERRGIDTEAIAQLLESHRRQFGAPLPHPKLDATARALRPAFETGEKALVFVRRVATVAELAAKLDATFDAWLRQRMQAALPGLESEIERLFRQYEDERRRRPEEQLETLAVDEAEGGEAEELLEGRRAGADEDPGSAETFFAWFFRGAGPRGVLSGSAFQRNRLSATSSAYSILFEDDHVAMLLGRPSGVFSALARASGMDESALRVHLRRRAVGHFRARSRQAEGYPRLLVFEAYQAAALEALAESEGLAAEPAQIVLQERFREVRGEEQEPPPGFPEPEVGIGIATFFTELARRPALREALWPEEQSPDFREQFRRQEQRRELLSAMARLGAAYIDLYLLAMRRLGGFDLKGEAELENPTRTLARDFLDLLERQREEPGFHAFAELSQAAACFDLLLGVNFPEVPAARLEELAALYGATLQRQVPVGRMAGGVNKRLVRQFRMPGFPLVLVSTDVLQEGEDLHTFCRRVIHYGITWTPSAMEQRTGRIDRIGGLVQRELDGRQHTPHPEAFLQVFYPHLRDTVEVLQVRRVLARLNRFLRLMHQPEGSAEDRESRIDAARAMLEELEKIPPLEGELQSAFPVREPWLRGELTEPPERGPDVDALVAHLDEIWKQLIDRLGLRPSETGNRHLRAGSVLLRRYGVLRPGDSTRNARHQRFQLELRSQAAGDATLLRCISPVGLFDLDDAKEVDRLYEAQRRLGHVRVAIRPDTTRKQDHVTVEADLPFHAATTGVSEIERLIERTALAADRLEADLLGVDEDSPSWHPEAEPSDA